jgi:hypothetical protein
MPAPFGFSAKAFDADASRGHSLQNKAGHHRLDKENGPGGEIRIMRLGLQQVIAE